DPAAIARVREEAWPRPADAEEVHEALLWMGYATADEARSWEAWLEELAAAGRVVREADRWFAAEASRDPKTVLRGRLEALGPHPRGAHGPRPPRGARGRGLGPAHAGGRQRSVVRPEAARPDPPLPARPPPPRDRAGHGVRVPPLPRGVAARRPRVPPRGATRS